MNRRGFLTGAGKLGTGSVLASWPPIQAVAQAEEHRRLLWYARHCVDCGIRFDGEHAVTDYHRDGGRHCCIFCAEYGSDGPCAVYYFNPPADYGVGYEWRR